MGHYRTHAPQQTVSLFDHVVGRPVRLIHRWVRAGRDALPGTGISQRARLNGSRKNGLVATVPAQAHSRATSERGASVPCQLYLSSGKLDQAAPGDYRLNVDRL